MPIGPKLLKLVQMNAFLQPFDIGLLNLASGCLDKMAGIVGTSTGLRVSRAEPNDKVTAWSAISVHPLQLGENQYQWIVKERGRAAPPADREEVESEALGEFFSLRNTPPKRLGALPADQGQWLVGEWLSRAGKSLSQAAAIIEARDGTKLAAVERQLKAVIDDAFEVAWSFFAAPPDGPEERLPLFRAVASVLAAASLKLKTRYSWDDLGLLVKNLRQVLAVEKEAQENAAASVQMSYQIESFYLFRLLVRYQINSAQPPADDIKAEVSGKLTALLTKQKWVGQLITTKLVALSRDLADLGGGDILFFLKGGRAIKYMEGKPAEGENDWDTQILINPNLPPEDWYALFRQVCDLVLFHLERSKREFFSQLQINAADFDHALLIEDLEQWLNAAEDDAPGNLPIPENLPDVAPPDEGADSATPCKAELIDVGLPRRDTVKGAEEWEQLNGRILTGADGMPYPGPLYYVEEYLTMLRGAASGISPSPKTPKRQKRLFDLLSRDDRRIDLAVTQVLDHIPLRFFPLSVNKIRRIGTDSYMGRLLTLILDQFMISFGLLDEFGLAIDFDSDFSGLTRDLVTDLGGLSQEQVSAGAGVGLVVQMAQTLSAKMEKHLVDRAAFLVTPIGADLPTPLAILQRVVRHMADMFHIEEQLTLQIAVTGNFAASLYADYLGYHPEDNKLEPITRVTVRVYARQADLDLSTLDRLTLEELTNLLDDPDHPLNPLSTLNPKVIQELFYASLKAVAADYSRWMTLFRTDTGLKLVWSNPLQQIGDYKYQPTLLEVILDNPGVSWPEPSYVWGYPVLGLGDLIADYRRRSAYVQEFGARRRMVEAIGELSELSVISIAPARW